VTQTSGGAWLFVRGRQAVRIVRREHSDGADLVVCGPAADEQTHTFSSVPECMRRQAEIEAGLMAEGFVLQSSSDRRRGSDRRRITRHDRRRPGG
jgi:hypothetical protein